MSSSELKILTENEFWVAAFKKGQTHSDENVLRRPASSAGATETFYKAVHRLDFETQGLLLLAREDKWDAYHALFKGPTGNNSTTKIYQAGASREISEGHFEGYIGSRYRSSKKTRFHMDSGVFPGYHSVLAAEHSISRCSATDALFGECSYEVTLLTGRRHQIRAFFASLDAPLIGDTVYGGPSTQKALALFSWKLKFIDPLSGEKIELEAPKELFQKD